MGNYLYLRPLGVDQPQDRLAPIEAENPPKLEMPFLAFGLTLPVPEVQYRLVMDVPKLNFIHSMKVPSLVSTSIVYDIPKLSFGLSLKTPTLSINTYEVPRGPTYVFSLLQPTLNKIHYNVDKLNFQFQLHVPELELRKKRTIIAGTATPAPTTRVVRGKKKKPPVEVPVQPSTEETARKAAEALRISSLAQALASSISQPVSSPAPVQTTPALDPLQLLAQRLLPDLKKRK